MSDDGATREGAKRYYNHIISEVNFSDGPFLDRRYYDLRDVYNNVDYEEIVETAEHNTNIIEQLADLLPVTPHPTGTTFHTMLAAHLGMAIEYPDLDAILEMDEGRAIVGRIDHSPTLPLGIHSWKTRDKLSLEDLHKFSKRNNAKLLASQVLDINFNLLIDKVVEERDRHKIALWSPQEYPWGLNDLSIAPSFGVQQKDKCRFISNYAQAKVNNATWVCNKATLQDNRHMLELDHIFSKTKAFRRKGAKKKAWKADQSGAYRQVGIKKSHQKYSFVHFWPYIIQHFVLPFGFAASVIGYLKLSIFINCIILCLLGVPDLSYIDDFSVYC